MLPAAFFVLLMLLAQIPVWRKHGARGVLFSVFPRSLRAAVVWPVLSFIAALFELGLVIAISVSKGKEKLAVVVTALVGAALLGAWLFSGTWLLALTRRRGPISHRLMYILGQVFFAFARTDEIAPGAILLAAMTLARRRPATAEERSWLWTKLRQQKSGLGTFAVATAVTLLLDARAARDEGRNTEATEATLLARAYLGTVSYATRSGVPGVVRRLADDLHALVSAELGDWGFVAIAEDGWLSDEIRALRAAVLEHMGDPRMGQPPLPEPPQAVLTRLGRFVSRLLPRRKPPSASPLADMVAARFPGSSASGRAGWGEEVSFEVAQQDARTVHAVLSRGEHVSAQEQFLLLGVFDRLLSPEAPETVIPAAMRDDEGRRLRHARRRRRRHRPSPPPAPAPPSPLSRRTGRSPPACTASSSRCCRTSSTLAATASTAG